MPTPPPLPINLPVDTPDCCLPPPKSLVFNFEIDRNYIPYDISGWKRDLFLLAIYNSSSGAYETGIFTWGGDTYDMKLTVSNDRLTTYSHGGECYSGQSIYSSYTDIQGVFPDQYGAWAGCTGGTGWLRVENIFVEGPRQAFRVIASNQAGASPTIPVLCDWSSYTLISGKQINGIAWSGTKWWASTLDGLIYSSPDGIVWTNSGHGAITPAKIYANGPVVLAVSWSSTICVSTDDGATWHDHTPYYGSPATCNGVCAISLGGGNYRLFSSGQSGSSAGCGIIAYADTNAMPSPGNPWTVCYNGVSSVVFDISAGASGGLVAAASSNALNATVLTSADGLAWAVHDTGIPAANTRSIKYSATHSVYFIGITPGGASGSLLTAPANLSSFTESVTGLGGAPDAVAEVDGKIYASCNAGGIWDVTPTSKYRVSTNNTQFLAAATGVPASVQRWIIKDFAERMGSNGGLAAVNSNTVWNATNKWFEPANLSLPEIRVLGDATGSYWHATLGFSRLNKVKLYYTSDVNVVATVTSDSVVVGTSTAVGGVVEIDFSERVQASSIRIELVSQITGHALTFTRADFGYMQ